jgi:hypothetical protein
VLPEDEHPIDAWAPFATRLEFDFAQHHFVEAQNSAAKIDRALDMWAASVLEFGGDSPWKTPAELYSAIDAIRHGDSPWKVYHIRYRGPLPPGTPPKWMTDEYELCTRDSRQLLLQQLASSHFKDSINLTPYQQFDKSGQRSWSNLMSGDWAWKQAVCGMAQVSTFKLTHTYSGRIRSHLIILHMAQCLCLLWLAVTRQPSPLPRDIKNTTRFICHQEI